MTVTKVIKRLVVWLLVTVPVGIAIGAGFSAYFGDNAAVDRGLAAFNGGLAGLGLAVVGAISATATNAAAYRQLHDAGGSERTTGLIVAYGVIVGGILLLYAFG